MTDTDVLVKAAADAVSARLAIETSARRRAAATTSAQHLIDLAVATERAERDAAWTALRASVLILLSERVGVADIAELCGVSVDRLRELCDQRMPGASASTGLSEHGRSTIEHHRGSDRRHCRRPSDHSPRH